MDSHASGLKSSAMVIELGRGRVNWRTRTCLLHPAFEKHNPSQIPISLHCVKYRPRRTLFSFTSCCEFFKKLRKNFYCLEKRKTEKGNLDTDEH
jgi:hypothetical protein